MRPTISVVKVGGSLVGDRARLRAVLAGLADGRDGRAVVVPGGGPFADAVRTAQTALGFDDALAHRLCIDAMGRMAEVYSALEPRLPVVRDIADDGAAVVWDPVALRQGRSDIPESWDVTSDSLALWLAATLRAERCILLKSAPCPTGSQPDELARLGLVDRAFPRFARKFAGQIALRGPSGEDTIVRDSLVDPPFRVRPRAAGGGCTEPRRGLRGAAVIPGVPPHRRDTAPGDAADEGPHRPIAEESAT